MKIVIFILNLLINVITKLSFFEIIEIFILLKVLILILILIIIISFFKAQYNKIIIIII